MVQDFNKLGVVDVFNSTTANLSKMINYSNNAKNVYISKIIHEAVVIVDEKGTEAAAVVIMRSLSINSVRLPPTRI